MNDVWKKFEENELTHSTAHHLMAIHDLLKTNGYARAIDVANHLGITRGSVSITLNKLKKKNLIVEDENKFLQLSNNGRELVNSVFSKRHILKRFLAEVLKLSPNIAEIDACKIEHLISRETGEKLMSFMGFFLSERDEVKQFKESFNEFSYECESTLTCQVCETECFYAGKN
jgi:DtxR family Mn-dependent transcriptional regulator